MIKFVRGIFPYTLSYIDAMKAWQGGVMRSCIIPKVRIRPKYRGDAGLLAHEVCHVKQFWRFLVFGPLVHPLLYKKWPKYRLKCEIEAYIVQIRHHDKERWHDLADYFAERIARYYNLSNSVADIQALLYAGL